MTILAQYAPLKVPTPVTGAYFAIENIGPESIEVWMETQTATIGVFDRVLLPQSQYQLFMGISGSSPAYAGGLVAFNKGAIPDTVDQISIERNTPIKQLADFSNFDPFHMDLIEFTLDKLTMIIQEIAERKCSIPDLGVIEQPLYFNRQDILYPSMLDSALDKINDYCLQMATGQDCKNDLENT